jgi:hypothetical protein
MLRHPSDTFGARCMLKKSQLDACLLGRRVSMIRKAILEMTEKSARRNRWPVFTTLGVLLTSLLLAASLAAQPPPTNPAPDGNGGILGPQLIAWSEVQKLQPISPQTASQPEAPQSEPDARQQTARTLTGVMAKVENNYVLQTGDSLTYKLDTQDKAKTYEGKRVRVEGIFNPTTNIFHVNGIQLF